MKDLKDERLFGIYLFVLLQYMKTYCIYILREKGLLFLQFSFNEILFVFIAHFMDSKTFHT